MIWAGIIGDTLVGLIRVLKGVKVTSIAYCNLLKKFGSSVRLHSSFVTTGLRFYA